MLSGTTHSAVATPLRSPISFFHRETHKVVLRNHGPQKHANFISRTTAALGFAPTCPFRVRMQAPSSDSNPAGSRCMALSPNRLSRVAELENSNKNTHFATLLLAPINFFLPQF